MNHFFARQSVGGESRLHDFFLAGRVAERSDRDPRDTIGMDAVKEFFKQAMVVLFPVLMMDQRIKMKGQSISRSLHLLGRLQPLFKRRRAGLDGIDDILRIQRPRNDRMLAMVELQKLVHVRRFRLQFKRSIRSFCKAFDKDRRKAGDRLQSKRVRVFAGADAKVKLLAEDLAIELGEHVFEVPEKRHQRMIEKILQIAIVAVVEAAHSEVDDEVLTADHAIRAGA
ncbi:MAG: hypothetical protein CVV45_13290 [Spirochaetae bacterium HGW-Spirochaetae-10]|nr:MAG: hypothetical protein CVV45_13290 [Spirochaetae bacterium HGW-Spirochaetae-10]